MPDQENQRNKVFVEPVYNSEAKALIPANES
jgi:hypothetical protein